MTTPTSNRLYAVASRLVAGRCSLVVEGDSISSEVDNRNPIGIAKKWDLTWAGWMCNTSNEIVTNVFASASSNNTYILREYDWVGVATPGVATPGSYPFGGTTINLPGINHREWSANGSDASNVQMAKLTRTQTALFIGTDFGGEALTIREVWWATALTPNLRIRSLRNGDTSSPMEDTDGKVMSGANLFRTYDMHITAGAGDAWTDMFTATGVNETGKEFLHVSAVFTRDGIVAPAGVLPVFNSHGGFKAEDFTNESRCSTTQRRAWYVANRVAERPYTVFMCQWGANQSPDAATFKSYCIAYIASRRADCAAMGTIPLFFFICNYDISGGTWLSGYADVMYQLSRTYSDVSFYNLYAAAGSYAALNGAGYIADGTHPSATGAVFFMDTVWQALSASNSAGVGTVSSAAGSSGGNPRRRRRTRA
jgi:hypothetical protein